MIPTVGIGYINKDKVPTGIPGYEISGDVVYTVATNKGILVLVDTNGRINRTASLEDINKFLNEHGIESVISEAEIFKRTYDSYCKGCDSIGVATEYYARTVGANEFNSNVTSIIYFKPSKGESIDVTYANGYKMSVSIYAAFCYRCRVYDPLQDLMDVPILEYIDKMKEQNYPNEIVIDYRKSIMDKHVRSVLTGKDIDN